MNHNFRIPRASEYIALLEERLSKRTLAHVLSVAEYMVSLSELLEIPYERAVTAGLLHDPENGRTKERFMSEAEAYGL